jgi:hypothetical protein
VLLSLGLAWVYIDAMARLTWPRVSRTRTTLAPRSRAWLAWLCLSQCELTLPVMPARRSHNTVYLAGIEVAALLAGKDGICCGGALPTSL